MTDTVDLFSFIFGAQTLTTVVRDQNFGHSSLTKHLSAQGPTYSLFAKLSTTIFKDVLGMIVLSGLVWLLEVVCLFVFVVFYSLCVCVYTELD